MKAFHCKRSISAGLFFCLFLGTTLLGADTWFPPTGTTAQAGSFELTTVARLNGCQFVLKRYTKTDPALAGYWTQEISIHEHLLIQITRQPATGTRTLKVENADGYAVLQVDRNGDGIYETFLICSTSDRKLIDVLLLTPNGWLRHGTKEDFSAGAVLWEKAQRPVQEINPEDDKAIRKVWDDMKGALPQPR